MQELWKNKLRTFLSLFGVTIGIFCIISVLATVDSLEKNIQTEIKSLGTNTIYIDKWDYSSSGPEFAYWKFAKRPVPRYNEVQEIKMRTTTAKHVAFKIDANDKIEFNEKILSNIRIYGISEEFSQIQPLEIERGRFITESEFGQGANAVVVGFQIAENLFGNGERALNKSIIIRGRQSIIVGTLKKKGAQLIGGWGFDDSVLMPYKYAKTIIAEERANPLIMVQGKDGINSMILKSELAGTMRTIRKLNPKEGDDFSLNDVNDFSAIMSKAFSSINLGGWIIGALAFIVGIFGVANIMFVTVKERTAQIGIKKAIGAKNRTILIEVLLESAFLCIIGGFIGLAMVYAVTRIVTVVFEFPIFLSLPIIGIACMICIIAGVMAGFVPALQASRMNPVQAIRTT